MERDGTIRNGPRGIVVLNLARMEAIAQQEDA